MKGRLQRATGISSVQGCHLIMKNSPFEKNVVSISLAAFLSVHFCLFSTYILFAAWLLNIHPFFFHTGSI
jgi:hypothetical protein